MVKKINLGISISSLLEKIVVVCISYVIADTLNDIVSKKLEIDSFLLTNLIGFVTIISTMAIFFCYKGTKKMKGGN